MTRIRAADLGDEVERYLAAPLETPADALVWWHERRMLYPNLSRMALDYLTIPGSSYSFLPRSTSIPKVSWLSSHFCRRRACV